MKIEHPLMLELINRQGNIRIAIPTIHRQGRLHPTWNISSTSNPMSTSFLASDALGLSDTRQRTLLRVHLKRCPNG
jgi:hypothetical protein